MVYSACCGDALKTALDDLGDFLGGQRELRLAREKVDGRESYRITVSPACVTLSAEDDEGLRRAIYRFEDRVQAGDLRSETRKPWLRHRFSRCFFAPTKRPPLYTDELMDDIDYYPDAYLNRLAHEGVNALWITVTFRDLAATSFTQRVPDAAAAAGRLDDYIQHVRLRRRKKKRGEADEGAVLSLLRNREDRILPEKVREDAHLRPGRLRAQRADPRDGFDIALKHRADADFRLSRRSSPARSAI